MVCSIFSSLGRLLFHLVDSFYCAGAFNDVYFCFYYLCVWIYFGISCKSPHNDICQELNCLCVCVCFLKEFYICSFNTQFFNSFWVNFLYMGWGLVQFHLFACNCPVFPAPFVGKWLFFSHCIFCLLCHKVIYHICFSSSSHSVPLIYVSIFMPVAYCFTTIALWYSWNQGMASQLCSFFSRFVKGCLGFGASLMA